VVMPTGNIIMMHLKNPIENRNLKWTIFWCINTIYFDLYISKFM
jgi:hypothetical protein